MIFPLLMMMALAACDNVATGQQTLVAFEEGMETRRANLNATGTAEIESVLLTLDVSQTRLARARSQGGLLAATLSERGIENQVIATATPVEFRVEAADPFGDLMRQREATQSAPLAAPPATPDPAAAPTDVQVTPFATETLEPASQPTPPPTTPPSFPDNLRDVVLASSLADNDCAAQTVTAFDTTAPRLYVVARAFDITPGTRISSVWLRGDEVLASFDFTPDFTIDNACIWFFADPSDFDFTPGDYTVQLQIDGELAAPPVDFPIQAP
ncbi:MAG: hypothetical protein EA396_01890 [Anaerolineaceae bacterium]|nr:MAG: hypothetical protein EA396_01890 [Anaerolineaceae bacterium]